VENTAARKTKLGVPDSLGVPHSLGVPQALGEPHSHSMMRHAKTILWWLMVAALVVTIVLLIFYRPAAYLAAIPLPLMFLAFLYVSYLESQATAKMLRGKNQTVVMQKEIDKDAQYAGIYTVLALVLLFGISALIMAGTMVEDLSMVGLSAAVIFLISIIYILPFIPLLFAEAGREEREKHDPDPVRDETPVADQDAKQDQKQDRRQDQKQGRRQDDKRKLSRKP